MKTATSPTETPIIAQTKIPGTEFAYSVPLTLTVRGGLHYITGNALPYFTLQGLVTLPRGAEVAGGMLHDLILTQFPHFADLAALHLSDLDGAPLHAEANAKYWLDEYAQNHDAPKAANALRRHLRVTEAQLIAILSQYALAFHDATLQARPEIRSRHLASFVHTLTEANRPRWRAESRACILHHQLQLCGDPFTPRITDIDDPACALLPPLQQAGPDVTHHDQI